MTPDRDRGYDEPTPWLLGGFLAVLTAVFVACILIGLYEVVAQAHNLVGVGAVLVVAGGLAPTAWTWRRRPVLRWFSWGAMGGQVFGVAAVVVLAIAGVP